MEINAEKKVENIVECTCRMYRVQTPGGLIVEVESKTPLSNGLHQKLLEEDIEINNFFKSHTILGVRRIIRPPPGQQRTTDVPKIFSKDGNLSPRQRLNQILQMKGEFTRQDYIKYLQEEFQFKINKWTSHNDIQDALKLNKIQIAQDRKGKSGRKYRVVDIEEVGDSLYKKLLEDRKLKMSTLE